MGRHTPAHPVTGLPGPPAAGPGSWAQAGRDRVLRPGPDETGHSPFPLPPGRVVICPLAPGGAASARFRLGLYRPQLQPFHSPARVSSEKRLEKLGEALEVELAAYGEARPARDGLETVQEQHIEAAVNLP